MAAWLVLVRVLLRVACFLPLSVCLSVRPPLPPYLPTYLRGPTVDQAAVLHQQDLARQVQGLDRRLMGPTDRQTGGIDRQTRSVRTSVKDTQGGRDRGGGSVVAPGGWWPGWCAAAWQARE